MILMQTIINSTFPNRGAANLVPVAALCNEQVALSYEILLKLLELPRPLLKYARQASLVEQPTLPGLGLQYCCSSCA